MRHLLQKYYLGNMELENRVIMAPMTRSRSTQPGDIPNEMMAEYYKQRASAGLIITEASQISPQGKGYSFTPGIYNENQVNGWQKVTQAVHEAGGKIFIQLWHVGRMSHESLHEDGITVAPSAIAPNAKVWVADESGVGRMVDCPVPKALTVEDIKTIVHDYRHAAYCAKLAGFDGIEIHAGNGYLLDQFLRTASNVRTDDYGGSIENRLRIFREIIQAVSTVYESKQIGIRLSPHNTSRGMDCPQITETVYALANILEATGTGYIHFAEADWDEAPEVPLAFRKKIREIYSGTIIVAGNYDQEKAETILGRQLADLVAFGRLFVGNPDLPYRFEAGAPLAGFDDTKLFGGSQTGYTDYESHKVMSS